MVTWQYIVTVVVTAIASVAVTSIIALKTVKLAVRQMRLYHSINLVELKPNKIAYWVLAGIVGLALVYLIMQMSSADGHFSQAFRAQFGVGRVYANVAFMFVLIVMFAAEIFLVSLGLSRNAVVDKGIYTDISLLDWHQVHDYIIDEQRGRLVLSSDKNTFSTLRHLTVPFRVKKSDIPKLKFILNKNKNKFSDFPQV